MRATHKGECQLCGRIQLLPKGALSTHGYTTRWGFFSGTCPGSRHQPFELSMSLIEGALIDAQNHVTELSSQVQKLRGEATTVDTMMSYTPDSARWGEHVQHWRKCRVVLSEYNKHSVMHGRDTTAGPQGWTVVWRGSGLGRPGSDARREDGTFVYPQLHFHVLRCWDVGRAIPPAGKQRTAVALEIATALNKRYATHLTGQINRMKTYQDWLVARKNSWTLRELQPRGDG